MKLDSLAVARYIGRTTTILCPILALLIQDGVQPWHLVVVIFFIGCFIELCGITDTLRIIGARHDKR